MSQGHRRKGVTGFGILFSVISVTSVFPAEGQSATPAPRNVFGLYGKPTVGSDSIQVVDKAAGRVGVRLKLYYANGHTCQLRKDANWSEDHLAIVAEGLEAGKPCRLNLFFAADRVALKDDGLACAPVYCGARGTLDQVSLPKFVRNRK